MKKKDEKTIGIKIGKKHIAVILSLLFTAALCLRIIPPFNQIFVDGVVRFSSVDAYYHMRIVDNLVQNFPYRMNFDIYTAFPYGCLVTWAPMFDWVVAAAAWIIGLGHPSQHLVDCIGAVFPAVLGASLVIPIYFIGKKIFNRTTGIFSAALITIIPGELLGRSTLGFTDHHVMEVLLVTVIALFTILAAGCSYKNWRTILCGVFLGLYILTWHGASLMLFVILTYILIRSVLFRKSVKNYSIVFLIAFLLSKLLLPSQSVTPFLFVALIGASILPLLLDFVERKIKGIYFPIVIASFAVVTSILVYFVAPDTFHSITMQFGHIFGWNSRTTISEMQPILFPTGNLTFRLIWGNFTTGSILFATSLIFVIYTVVKQKEDQGKVFLLVWTLVMLAATLAQRRFAYYFAINIALLTGYLSWLVLKHLGIEKIWLEKIDRHKIKQYINSGLLCVTLFFVVFFPNIEPAVRTASEAVYAPNDNWHETLSWMRENTSEPFGESAAYYKVYSPEEKYPDTAYGVMSWWDYGHWITKIARRPPNASPATHGSAPTFFTVIDENELYKMSDSLNIRYVIIDNSMVTSKFYAIVMLSSSRIAPVDPSEFYDIYYVMIDDKYVPKMLYHEKYYNSATVRMYNFECKSVSPEEVPVITYEERVAVGGKKYKLVTDVRVFQCYGDAVKFVSAANNRKIFSVNPFVSPVPLDKLDKYKIVYLSGTGVDGSPEIKVFQYVP